MANASNPVDRLNKMAGRSIPKLNKRSIHESEIMFSPEVTTRRTSGLQRGKLLNGNFPMRARRDSLGLPGGDEETTTIQGPVSKRLRMLSRAKEANPSPLKRLGSDPPDMHAEKVNLNESPAKRTGRRSRNPKAQKKITAAKRKEMNDTTRTPSKSTHSPSKRRTRTSVIHGEHEAPAATWEEHNPEMLGASTSRFIEGIHDADAEKVAAEGAREVVEEPEAEGEEEESEAEDEVEDEVEHEFEDQEAEKAPSRQKDGEHLAVRRKPGKSPRVNVLQSGNSSKSRSEESAHQTSSIRDHTDRRPAKQKATLFDRSQHELEERMEREKKFGTGIEYFTSLLDCEALWRQAGGAALASHELSPGVQPESAHGTDYMRYLKQLRRLNSGVQSYKSMASSERARLVQLFKQLSAINQELRNSSIEGSNSRGRSKLVRDLYYHIVPDMFRTIRRLLRSRSENGPPDSAFSKVVMDLLKMTGNLCSIARDWHPRPSGLETGILQLMRRDIAPPVATIVSRFEEDEDNRLRRKRDQVQLKELEEEQAEFRQKLRDRYSALLTRGGNLRNQPVGTLPILTGSANLVDIDDYDTEPPLGLGSRSVAPYTIPTQRLHGTKKPRLQREPTAELAPDPTEGWTDEEKIALLNGLQQYVGSSRYWDILAIHDVLRKRTLEELEAAATYYSGVAKALQRSLQGKRQVDFSYLDRNAAM